VCETDDGEQTRQAGGQQESQRDAIARQGPGDHGDGCHRDDTAEQAEFDVAKGSGDGAKKAWF
jgi:hypothetical protein